MTFADLERALGAAAHYTRLDVVQDELRRLDVELQRLRRLASFRSLPWYRRAWLTLTGKAPR